MEQLNETGTRGGSEAREKNTTALLDAAENLLVRVGHAGVTSRALAKEAGINNGLVHYYFGTMDEVFMQVIERMTDQLVDRQRTAFSGSGPLVEKWRAAWRDHESDIESGRSKLRLELRAMAWNKPKFQTQMNRLDMAMRDVLLQSFVQAESASGLDQELPAEGLVALLTALGEGFGIERLSGIHRGHDELLAWMEALLQARDGQRTNGRLHPEGVTVVAAGTAPSSPTPTPIKRSSPGPLQPERTPISHTA